MKLQLILGLWLTTFGACRAETLQFLTQEQPDPAAFAQAINHYVKAGEKSARRELAALPEEDQWRVFYLCRVLYQPKKTNQALRLPLKPMRNLRGYASKEDIDPIQRWPLHPVALVGKSYFILAPNQPGVVEIGAPAETTKEYLSFCRWHGRFRQEMVPVPTPIEARHDMLGLRDSAAWKATKWRTRKNETELWMIVKAQADAVK